MQTGNKLREGKPPYSRPNDPNCHPHATTTRSTRGPPSASKLPIPIPHRKLNPSLEYRLPSRSRKSIPKHPPAPLNPYPKPIQNNSNECRIRASTKPPTSGLSGKKYLNHPGEVPSAQKSRGLTMQM